MTLTELKNRIDNMVGSHRDDLLEIVLSFLGRLATVIAVIVGIGALISYRDVVLPTAPDFILVSGVALVFGWFGLLVWVAISGWHKLAETRGYSWSTHAIGAVIMVFSMFFIIAGAHAAFVN
ncbi:hypothetical protein [Marinobacter arenosus]|uniref:hypothetical protein n=1 Tax=Marinobacter arenosus TaxID=2856822 RepID=UPI001C4BC987|nr:hypothetical protein [Marinobacter arenosus]MBW0149544.1 hypothetical protein [Marinobacter arenosus]